MSESTLSPPTSSPAPEASATAAKVANLPEHRHCDVCGRSVAMGVKVCSPECQKKFDDAVKARKRSVYIFIALFALILFLSVSGGQLGAFFR
jgi:predicted nucleic acid-binding Zn ribbon protein